MKPPRQKGKSKLPPPPRGGGAAARQRQFEQERGLEPPPLEKGDRSEESEGEGEQDKQAEK